METIAQVLQSKRMGSELYSKPLRAAVVTTKMDTAGERMEVALADGTGVVKMYCYRKDLMSKIKDTIVIRNFTKGKRSDCLFTIKSSIINPSVPLMISEERRTAATLLVYPTEAQVVALSDIDSAKPSSLVTVTGEVVSVS